MLKLPFLNLFAMFSKRSASTISLQVNPGCLRCSLGIKLSPANKTNKSLLTI